MPRVVFTPNLRRFVDCPESSVAGGTVRACLDEVFARHETLRGYVVDEHGRLRTHMVIYVDGEPIKDRESLGDLVTGDAEIYVMQALSGG